MNWVEPRPNLGVGANCRLDGVCVAWKRREDKGLVVESVDLEVTNRCGEGVYK